MVEFEEEKQKKQLEDIRKKEEEELVQVMAETRYNLPYIDLRAVPIDNESLRIIPEEDAKKLGVAPFKLVGKKIYVAIISPNKEGIQTLKEELKKRGFTLYFYMASHESLKKVWERYADLSYAERSKAGGLDVAGDVLLEIAKKIQTIPDVKPLIGKLIEEGKSHAISRILEVIMSGAVALDASDIHLESEEERMRLRYRIDGVLHDIMFLDLRIFKLIKNRIKLLSGMKLTIVEAAQDGRFSVFLEGDEVNIRVSTVPGAYGEGIVMRLLNPKSIKVKLEELGIHPKLLEVFRREIRKPNGLILVTGPTGSGKTTTLYSFLREIYNPEIKMITIEDPIEYHLTGITQTQVEVEHGYTFLAGLRAALRQDPDVVMVGEIRDRETAEICVQASLTGHIVFSTLHTNDAAGAIPRLIDLGVNPKVIPSALSLAIAQRLLRKLCPDCKKEAKPTTEEERIIRDTIKTAIERGRDLSSYDITPDQEIKIWKPGKGSECTRCGDIGYKGRIAVFEAILSDEKIAKIIPTMPSDREVRETAFPQGILTMKEDGIFNKILTGMSSLEELGSVVDLYRD